MLTKKDLANGKKPKQGRTIQEGWHTEERDLLFSHDFADFSAVVCVVCFRNLGQAEPDTAVWISFYLLCHFNIVLLLSLSLSVLHSTVGLHPSLSSFIALFVFSRISHFELLLMLSASLSYSQCPWQYLLYYFQSESVWPKPLAFKSLSILCIYSAWYIPNSLFIRYRVRPPFVFRTAFIFHDIDSVSDLCWLHIHDANLPIHHIPNVLYWIEMWLWRPFEYSELNSHVQETSSR